MHSAQNLPSTRVIALINQKGGVGKTTSTANLGACLAESGRQVLIVDFDPQHNLTVHMGVDPDNLEYCIRDVMTTDTPLNKVICPTPQENLFIAPTNIEMANVEVEIASVVGREIILREKLQEFEHSFDYILIDCPPSLSLLTLNALTTVQEVFIVQQCEFFALQGASRLVETIRLVQKRLNTELKINGIITTLYDKRKNINKEIFSHIQEFFGSHVFPTPIRTNVTLTEAPSHGLPINMYNPRANGTKDYRALAQAVMAQEAAIFGTSEEEQTHVA